MDKGDLGVKKGKLTARVFGIVLILAFIGMMLGGIPELIDKVEASPITIYVPDDYLTIQAAVDAASPGDTIIVRAGTYTENIDVNTDHLTIQSENGAAKTIIKAANEHDHVLELTADYVTVVGFNITGTTTAAGIYLNNANFCHISDNIGQYDRYLIRLVNSDHNTIENNTSSCHMVDGISLKYSNNNIVKDNDISNDPRSGTAIDLHYSTNNLVVSNTANKYNNGIVLFSSNNNTINGNTCLGNEHTGIGLSESSCNIVEGNTVSSGGYGYSPPAYCIILYSACCGNTIRMNILSGYSYGFHLSSSCTNNILQANIISHNAYGIRFNTSSNNSIYLNNFMNSASGNTNSYPSSDSTNLWCSPREIVYTYNGKSYTSYLGNYWEDYAGEDAGGDGIGDTPYPVVSYPVVSNTDNYPLMEPFENYEVGIPLDYAIIVAGQGAPLGEKGWPADWLFFSHSADNAYRALRNLGFEDDHIFYLNSERQLKINGENVVDAPASVNEFRNAFIQIRDKVGDTPTPLILYLVGHGDKDIFVFDPENDGVEFLLSIDLRDMLEDSPFAPLLIMIWSCDSGSFITKEMVTDSISIEGKDRIIITATHDNDTLEMYDLARSSDRFWGNINKGLNVKDAFVTDATERDIQQRLLDDNGDKIGHPPNNLGDDGELAAATQIGTPGTENLELTPWILALIKSPGELRIYDSQNRVTGLVNGEIKEEIPNSIYDEQNGIVAIFPPFDIYHYEVTGTGEGTYGLEIDSIEGADAIIFTATDIPTTTGATHQYTIDWNALSQDEEGVTINVDSDGDGEFDNTFTSDKELTRDEFIFSGYLGCFIATAAYGTPIADEVQVLRDFRDEYLLTNPLGQAFVDIYYQVSPPIAEFITEHPSLKPIVRTALLPAVVISYVFVNTSPAVKIAILGLLVLVSVVVAVWVIKQRSRDSEYT
jgi:parallel beta-helix repeat protein